MWNQEVLIGFVNPSPFFLLCPLHVIQAFRVLYRSYSLSLRDLGCVGQSYKSKGVSNNLYSEPKTNMTAAVEVLTVAALYSLLSVVAAAFEN